MTYDYDVIVVGGRVAGASTGLLLARRGHRVLIVERASMPSDTMSTHAILRSGVLQLSRWDVLDRIVEAGTPPVRHITLGFGPERIPFEIRPDFGVDTLYAPRRYILDNVLVEAAIDAGAEFRGRTRMTDLLRTPEGQVYGIVLGSEKSTENITSRFVIGADGYRSRVADLVGAVTYRAHEPTNAIHYAYYEGIEASGFWFQFTPGVNAGLVPTNDGQCLVFVGRPAHLRGRFRDDPEQEFARLIRVAGPDIDDIVANGERASPFRGTSGLAGFIRQAWGPGWALVGDAGYTKDPISAHGISDALRDAELCARAVDTALTTPAESVEALDGYETLRNSLSEGMFEQSTALARFDWDPGEASRRMRIISEEVRSECQALLSAPAWSALALT